jgi:hypothetical protein
MWRGMYATYPPLVPPEHVLAARLCRQRQMLFEGEVSELPLTALPNAKHFAALSNQNGKRISCQIDLTPGLKHAISHLFIFHLSKVNGGSEPRSGCTTWEILAFRLPSCSALSIALPCKSSFCMTLATTICRAKLTERLKPQRRQELLRYQQMVVRLRPHPRRVRMSVSLARWISCSWGI